MRAVAAGHPATAEAGAEILEEGGSAADAVVAACLASCVAETVMTGLLGGGHAIHFDAATGRAANLDCFVAVPGLGREGEPVALLELEVPFGIELVHYAVGIGSCGVPGRPCRARRPLARSRPASLAAARRAGSATRPRRRADACGARRLPRMLEPVMTMNEGARIYSPGGKLLAEGDLLRQPGLVGALEALAEEGPRSAYEGTLARALLGADGGARRARHRARTSRPTRRSGANRSRSRSAATASGRAPGSPTSPRPSRRLAELRGLSEPERALAWVAALLDEPPAQHGTTNICAIDADGNACVLTTSLGLGSGDFVPGFDLHLNSMLGEADLLTGPLEPGERMASMMAPTIALDADGVALAVGAAGGTRLRSALLQVVAGILDEGLEPQAAVDRPRLHPVASLVHLEPGFGPETTGALESAGFEVRVWPDRHHYFGGVSAITPNGAAGDPRRNGESRVV